MKNIFLIVFTTVFVGIASFYGYVYIHGNEQLNITERQKARCMAIGEYDETVDMYEAIETNNCKQFLKTVMNGEDIGKPNDEGVYPLFLALENNRSEIFNILLTLKANVNIKNRDGESLLHVAVIRNNNDLVQYLLTRGADVNTLDRKQKTPLMYAIENKSYKIIQTLLVNGADADRMDSDNNSLLFDAIDNNDNYLVKTLLVNGVNLTHLNGDGKSSLEKLISSPIFTFDYIQDIKNNIETTSDDSTRQLLLNLELWDAMNQDNKALVKDLLNKGADVNWYFPNVNNDLNVHYPMEYYAIKNDIDMLKYVLETKKSNIENINLDLFDHIQIQDSYKDILEYLLTYKDEYLTHKLLDNSIVKGNFQMFSFIVRNGAEKYLVADSTNSEQLSYIHMAAQGGNVEIVEYLLNKGFNINATITENGKKVTPLYLAINAGKNDVVEYLLKKGATINTES